MKATTVETVSQLDGLEHEEEASNVHREKAAVLFFHHVQERFHVPDMTVLLLTILSVCSSVSGPFHPNIPASKELP
jgi:hypothetical protein